ncbi:MAG: hypothetical protein WBQ44_06270 [Rhodococcus sp. (in: high G+C Gram-positive bacteria)]
MNETGTASHVLGAPDIDCLDFLPLVDELLDIDDKDWDATVVRHLQQCPPCRIFLEQLEDLRHLLRSRDSETIGPDDPRIVSLFVSAQATRKDTGSHEHHSSYRSNT